MRRIKLKQHLPLLLILLMLLPAHALPAADDSALQRFEYKEYHMGVDARIVVYAKSRAIAEKACAAAFERFAELDTIMSDYRANSELMQLCAKAGGPPVRVSRDLFKVLERSQEVARRSDGGFDVTCGPIVKLWRKARKAGALPEQAEIEKARALVGWQKMRLDAKNRTVQLLVPGMMLDLGGIAKGYADDCAQTVLKHLGIQSALVEAGGDIVVTDPPPGHAGWTIQVANAGGDAEAPVLSFANTAVSTSGDTEQFVDIAGKHFSHIVDPRKGMPLTDRIQVTIVARDGLTSDGLSTAVSVLGVAQGRKLAKTYPGTRAYIRFLPGI